MNYFDRAPIRRSLMTIGLLSNGIAVVMLSAMLGASEWFSYRDRAVTALAAYADVVGGNLAPALMFEDTKAGQEVLNRLAVEPSVVNATLHDRNGRLMAQFHVAAGAWPPAQLPTVGGHLFFADQLVLAREVRQGSEQLGTLYLQSDLGGVRREFARKLALILIAMGASLAFGLFLFNRLQRSISQPLQALVQAMQRVTHDGDYSARVPAAGSTELRAIGSGFNTMLAAIRERETELVEHRAHLESAVRARTDELRQLNDSLERRVHEEAAKNREKDHLLIRQSRLATLGEMIGNIAHQWRQPINALGLLLTNLRDAQRYNELDRAYLDAAVDKGRHLIESMSSTIDDFRGLFKPDRERTRFDVAAAVRGALTVVEASFKNAHIGIALDMADNPVCVGFPNEYTHVVLNLLGNARDAIQARGAGGGQVALRVFTENGRAVVSIRDNGGGIPTAIIDRIFDPYFTTRENGTGIGLYMSLMIIEKNMNGAMEAHNVADGAEFRIVTPLADKEDCK